MTRWTKVTYLLFLLCDLDRIDDFLISIGKGESLLIDKSGMIETCNGSFRIHVVVCNIAWVESGKFQRRICFCCWQRDGSISSSTSATLSLSLVEEMTDLLI